MKMHTSIFFKVYGSQQCRIVQLFRKSNAAVNVTAEETLQPDWVFNLSWFVKVT